MNSTNCLLCGCQAERVLKDLPGFKEPLFFDIYSCKKCYTSFSLPRIDDNSMLYNEIYNLGNKLQGYGRYWIYSEGVKTASDPLKYLAEIEDTYFGIRQAMNLFRKEKSKLKILEVGCGLGYLTFSLNKAGFKTTGLDISESAVSLAKRNYGDYYIANDIFKFSKENPGNYDLVILTEVIEHLNDVTGFFEALYWLLSSNGKIIITTPNKSLYKNKFTWFTELPPVHSLWFSENSFKYLASKYEMKLSFINFKKYYKNSENEQLINLNELEFTPTSLNRKGEIIKLKSKEEKTINGKNKNVLKRFKVLLGVKIYNLARRMLYSFRRDYVVLGKRGKVICAVFYK